MLRWSSSFHVPFYEKFPKKVFSTLIGNDIWFTTDGYFRKKIMNLMVFNTETQKFSYKKCKYDGERPYEILNLTSIDNTIYILAFTCINTFVTLFKADATSLEWTKVVTFPYCGLLSDVFIINNQMYFTANNDDFLEFCVIDLSTNQFTKHASTNYRVDGHVILLKNNEQLYAVIHHETQRSVSLIENGKLINVAEDKYQECEDEVDVFPKGYGGNILYKSFRNRSRYLYMETFDFELKSWARTEIESSVWQNRTCLRIDSGCQIGEKIYTFIKSHNYHQYEIRILELNPTLSTIGLMSLVDDLIKKNQTGIESIEEQCPIPLRKMLSNMLKWRLVSLKLVEEKQRNPSMFMLPDDVRDCGCF